MWLKKSKQHLRRKNKLSSWKKNGMTLIEVILVVSLFAIVLMAITSGFYVGNRAWRMGVGQSNKEYKIYLGLERINSLLENGIYFSNAVDGHNDYYYTWFGFKTDNNTLSFAQLIEGPKNNNSLVENNFENVGGIEKIDIFQEGESVVMVRRNISDVINNQSGKRQVFIPNIKTLSFKYGYLDGESTSGDIKWEDQAKREGEIVILPQAIRLVIEYPDNKNNLVTLNEDVFLAQTIAK